MPQAEAAPASASTKRRRTGSRMGFRCPPDQAISARGVPLPYRPERPRACAPGIPLTPAPRLRRLPGLANDDGLALEEAGAAPRDRGRLLEALRVDDEPARRHAAPLRVLRLDDAVALAPQHATRPADGV